MKEVEVAKAQSESDLEFVYSIRTEVFVNEQGCPRDLEYAHEKESTHFLARCNGTPCGAARWRRTENGVKLERFAVLHNFRRMGVGAALVKAVLADLPTDAETIYLNAQLSAVPFYESLGFQGSGDIFEEAGIMHRRMTFADASQK